MQGVPFILSLAYREQIDEACKPLINLGLKHFVMYLIFNDGSTFALSNVYSILKPYYQEGLYKEDFTYTQSLLTCKEGYYFCRQAGSLSEGLRTMLADKYAIFPIYNLVRHHPECTFVLSAIRDLPLENEELFYSKTVNKFESFCIDFIDRFIDLILTYNPAYRHSFILTNKQLRDAVIKGGYNTLELSFREKECLWLAAQGKTSKQIAQALKISPFTVEQRLKRVREELHCKTLIEAIIESIHRGIIGKVNPYKSRFSETTSSPVQTFARPKNYAA